MKKGNIFKRIMAIAGAAVLVIMYLLTLYFAIFDDAKTMSFFWASVVLTVFVPIFIYANQVVYRVLKGRNVSSADKDENKDT